MSSLCFFVVLAATALSVADALKFGPTPVSVDTEVLIVNRPARLTCNYVKYRTETVREIDWFVGYSGFRTKVFSLSTTTGVREGSELPFVETDENSATEDELTVTLREFRSANMTFGCEVQTLRDNGYGKLKHNKKLGESQVRVVNDQNHDLVLKPEPASQRTAVPGQEVTFVCISRGADPPPRLSLVIDGRNVTEIYGGSVVEAQVVAGGKSDYAVQGNLVEAAEELFRDDFLRIECLAHYDDFLFDKKELALAREEPQHNRRQSHQPYYGQQGGSYNPSSSAYSSRQGRVSPSTSSFPSPAEPADQGRFLEALMMTATGGDPARHAMLDHVDHYAGYVLLQVTTIDAANTAGVRLLGKLPYEVETELHKNYGRINKVSDTETRVKMIPTEILNQMGSMGYRVTGSAPSGPEGHVWTLERRDVEAAHALNEL